MLAPGALEHSSFNTENNREWDKWLFKIDPHIMLLEGPPTPLAGPLSPGWEALVPPTPRPAALPTPGPPVPLTNYTYVQIFHLNANSNNITTWGTLGTPSSLGGGPSTVMDTARNIIIMRILHVHS